MTVEELRIGNWFVGGWKGNAYFQVIPTYFAAWGGIYGTFPEPNPIPLTPEILVNSGFIKIQEGSMSHPEVYRKTYIKCIVTNVFDIHMRGGDENYWVEGNATVELKYIHQLQNLFFSLSGKELEINL